jgi:hypothetical protein
MTMTTTKYVPGAVLDPLEISDSLNLVFLSTGKNLSPRYRINSSLGH